MSDSENNDIVLHKEYDFTEFDLKAIEQFESEGLPGVASIDDKAMINMMSLYLSGKTYREIARITRKKKMLVLYISKKFNWYAKKIEYLRDLEETMVQRTLEAKLMGHDFLLQVKHYFEKKIGSNITRYLATNDESFAEKIDLKEIDRYIKTFEALEKLSTIRSRSEKNSPSIGLNVGDGVTITKKGDNSLEISPKQKAIGDVLKELADFRRKEGSQNEQEKEEKNDEN